MCHPNSNERIKSEDILNVDQEATIGPQFDNQEENILEIQMVLPLDQDYQNRLETLERNDIEETQLEPARNPSIGEITNSQSNLNDSQRQNLNRAILQIPRDRRHRHNFNRSRGQSLRHKRRFLRRQERKGMHRKLNKINKLLRKTVRRINHIKNLVNQQVQLVKHLQVIQPNSEGLLTFTE